MSSSDDSDVSANADDYIPSSTLLNFASHGQTLIAELLALSRAMPPEFSDPRFEPVMFDLKYFNNPADLERRVEENTELSAIDDKLRESCSDFLNRFFLLVCAIVKHYHDLCKYMNDLQEGTFGRSTLEGIMENKNDLQLLSESLVLFGCLQLLLVQCMAGSLREKLLVAYTRFHQSFDAHNINDICLLCREYPSVIWSSLPLQFPTQSSSASSSLILIQSPEDLIARFPFPKKVVDAVISCLLHNDLYDNLCHYPEPEHRTVALSSQASYLCILLLYSTEHLQNRIVMRELIERFFKDCWVVPVSVYFLVDLSLAWHKYKAARTFLSSCLSPTLVHDLSKSHHMKVKDLLLQLEDIQSNGTSNGEYVMQNMQFLLSLVRKCNISVRWLLLHRYSKDNKLRDLIISTGNLLQVGEKDTLKLLIETSQLELELEESYKTLLESKEIDWKTSRDQVIDLMKTLSIRFSISQASSRMIKNENPKDFFEKLALQFRTVEHKNPGVAGQKLQRMLSILKEIEQNCQMEGDLQVKQLLLDACRNLTDMLRSLGLKNDTLVTLEKVRNTSYAWNFLGCFVDILSNSFVVDLSAMLKLQPFFLKLHFTIDELLLRVAQNRSCDLHVISNYYSSELVTYMQQIIKKISLAVFEILDQNAECILQVLHLPHRMDRDHLPKYMQMDQQLSIAKVFSKISAFSTGLLKTLASLRKVVGQKRVDNWLEGEIRKEACKRLQVVLRSIPFLTNVKLEALEGNVKALRNSLTSQQHLIECFQELAHLQELQVWEQELAKMLKWSIQEEFSHMQLGKRDRLLHHTQMYDLSTWHTFTGRLLHQILSLTNPSFSMYLGPMSRWFDAEGHERLGLRFFHLLESCIGPVGLSSLDCLLWILIVQNLEHAVKAVENQMKATYLHELEKLLRESFPAIPIPILGLHPYAHLVKFIDVSWDSFIDCLARVGQLQLLRCLLLSQIKLACKVNANSVSLAVDGLLSSLRSMRMKPQKYGESSKSNILEVIHGVKMHGIQCGFCSPLQTSYVLKDPPPYVAHTISIITISQLSRYVVDMHLNTLASRTKKVALDSSPLMIGIGTFLRQFDPTFTTEYVQYMGQYIRTLAETINSSPQGAPKGSLDPKAEALKSIFWLRSFCKEMDVSKDLMDSCVPPALLSTLEAQVL